MKIRTAILGIACIAILGALAWGGLRLVRASTASTALELPTTRVKLGRVTLTVAARGELQGGKSEMLTAPMISGGDMAITYLRDPGEMVEPGDVVCQLDTTEQDYKLKEAEADLAEAQQQVIKAEADSEASSEETLWAVTSAQNDVKLAEIELRRNPTLAAIKAKQNQITLDAARNRLHQATQDLKNKQTTATAGIAIQKAQENKARVSAELARKNIENMTLNAKTAGYINIQQNTNINFGYRGMQLLPYQIGDTIGGGMAVAQIPDLDSWELSASVGELDRGHVSVGQPVTVRVVALAGLEFTGKVKFIGGTTGSSWDRHFDTRIALDQASPQLRPGMTSNLVITVGTLDNVLWIPSQALFESDGRSFVYARGPNGFVPRDVTLVQRSESQAVIAGLAAGDVVAMSNPDQQLKSASTSGGAMKALSK
jgi:hypothetical protein